MKKEKIPLNVYAAIFATGILSFSGVLIETSMNIAFPTLMKQFQLSTNTVSWMTSIYLLTISIIVPLSANLKQAFKTKTLFIFANLFFLVGLLTDALAPSFIFLLLGRVIQGLGTGIALPLMFNIIMEQVPKDQIGKMMGIGNMITGIAPAIGPTFGGMVITSIGWRWIFYIIVPLIVISLFLGIWGIQQKSELNKVKFDVLSIALIAIFFTGMIYGFSNFSNNSLFSMQVTGSILIALLALALLVYRGNHLEQPILNLKLFKNPSFSAHVTSFFIIQLLSLGNAFLLPNYIQLVNGNTAFVAGIVVLPAGAIGAVMSIVGGRLYDRLGARTPILLGTSFMLLELVIFAIFANSLSNVAISLVYILYMGGMGMILGVVMTDTLELLPEKEVPQGNAILNTVQQFAGAMGTAITSAIVAFSQTSLHSKGSVATSLGTRNAYIFLVVLALIMIILLAKFVKSGND